MKDVIISLEGLQTDPQGEEERISLTTIGTLSQGEEGLLLCYEETITTGLENTTTTFIVEEHQTTLKREGELYSQMVFQAGRRHLSLYNTPYGSLTITVHTHKLESSLSYDGGRLEIHYDVEINQEMVGRNIFDISVKVKQ
ncbi:MAG: DUF1934 domain-containing protein [Eubacteriales bacterium]